MTRGWPSLAWTTGAAGVGCFGVDASCAAEMFVFGICAFGAACPATVGATSCDAVCAVAIRFAFGWAAVAVGGAAIAGDVV